MTEYTMSCMCTYDRAENVITSTCGAHSALVRRIASEEYERGKKDALQHLANGMKKVLTPESIQSMALAIEIGNALMRESLNP